MANRIRALRQEKGIKQIELARAVSVSQAALSGYETGRYEPDFATLKKIADYFAVSVDYLLGHNAPPSSGSGTAPLDQEQIMAAFWGGDQDLTDEDKQAMWADVKNFAAFIAQKKKQEKQQHD